MSQDAHERWNARNYPGTLQLCCLCEQPTGRCEEDALYVEPAALDDDATGPFCPECYETAAMAGIKPEVAA